MFLNGNTTVPFYLTYQFLTRTFVLFFHLEYTPIMKLLTLRILYIWCFNMLDGFIKIDYKAKMEIFKKNTITKKTQNNINVLSVMVIITIIMKMTRLRYMCIRNNSETPLYFVLLNCCLVISGKPSCI